MTPTQKAIIRAAQIRGGTITSEDASKLIEAKYFGYAGTAIEHILSRMVDAGLLTRVKPGVFTIGNGKGKANAKPDVSDDGQSSLFGN